MIRYSERALATRPAFYAAYNDITIIVEDEGDENFYTNLCRHLLEDTLRIWRVIGVGGKAAVLKRFTDHSDARRAWKEFYLVDGDFDDLLGNTLPPSERFYRLQRYDIESYLVEEAAICRVAEEQAPRRDLAYYRATIGFGVWHGQVVDSVTPLVACFALLQELGQALPEGGQSIERFVSGSNAAPDIARIGGSVESVRDSQAAIGPEEFDQRLATMVERLGHSNAERLRWVSGKHIFLPLIDRRIRKVSRRNVAADSLRFRLTNYCELDSLSELRERILSLLVARTLP